MYTTPERKLQPPTGAPSACFAGNSCARSAADLIERREAFGRWSPAAPPGPAAATFIPLQAFAADELPKELLLRCEGTMNAVQDVPKPQTRRAGFTVTSPFRD